MKNSGSLGIWEYQKRRHKMSGTEKVQMVKMVDNKKDRTVGKSGAEKTLTVRAAVRRML